MARHRQQEGLCCVVQLSQQRIGAYAALATEYVYMLVVALCALQLRGLGRCRCTLLDWTNKLVIMSCGDQDAAAWRCICTRSGS